MTNKQERFLITALCTAFWTALTSVMLWAVWDFPNQSKGSQFLASLVFLAWLNTVGLAVWCRWDDKRKAKKSKQKQKRVQK